MHPRIVNKLCTLGKLAKEKPFMQHWLNLGDRLGGQRKSLKDQVELKIKRKQKAEEQPNAKEEVES